MLSKLVADDVICAAYAWLCKQRLQHPPNADIWHFSFHKEKSLVPLSLSNMENMGTHKLSRTRRRNAGILSIRQVSSTRLSAIFATDFPGYLAKAVLETIKQDILSNRYIFTPLQIIEKQDGSKIAMWSARDALVLKMLTMVLQPILPCHTNCMHIKGHGGSKQAVQATHDRIASKQYPYVIRTDIKGYYANIAKHQLLEQLAEFISCPIILNLLSQYLFYSVEQGGNFHTPRAGISRGCSLSPLMAGFQLYCIDEHFSRHKHLRYQRYMDDFLILCKTRWQLRLAVKQLNQFFHHFGFKQHPDKTFIGKVVKGFDWLGYQFNQSGVISASPRTLANFSLKLRQLYEQPRRFSAPKVEIEQRVVEYVVRWLRWLTSGLRQNISTILYYIIIPCVIKICVLI